MSDCVRESRAVVVDVFNQRRVMELRGQQIALQSGQQDDNAVLLYAGH